MADSGEMPEHSVKGVSNSGFSYAFFLLGEPRITRAGLVAATPPQRAWSLLAMLLLRPDISRRERLAELLFPDLPPRAGRRRLSDLLWLIRAALPDLPLVADAHELALPLAVRWLDTETFVREASLPDLDAWRRGLALYRGDLCAGLYDEWLLPERENIYLQYVTIAHRAADSLLRAGRAEEASAISERLVRDEPYDERALRMLMRAQSELGRRGAALAAYERYLALAMDELGCEPEQATRALVEAIRIRATPVPLVPEAAVHSLSADGLLRAARRALDQGDWATVQSCLNVLAERGDAPTDAVLTLALDLALRKEDDEHAEQLLAQAPRLWPALRARAAALALQRHDLNAAHDGACEALLEAHEIADDEAELLALEVLALVQQQRGQSPAAMRASEQALALARSLDDRAATAQALVTLGWAYCAQGRYVPALAHLHEACSIATEHGLRYTLGLALRGLQMAQCYAGQLTAALNTAEQELSLWRDLGLPRREAEALEGLALIHDLSGKSYDSLRALERAAEISRRMGDPLRIATNQYHLACTLIYQDDANAPRAITIAQSALEILRRDQQDHRLAPVLTILGYALWVGGDHAPALDALRAAASASNAAGELNRLPELLAYQGLAHLGLNQPARALTATRQAILALTQGAVSQEVVPEIHYAHAMALQANGLSDPSRAYLMQAYEALLAGAAEIEDEAGRQAIFFRNPTTRRLMRALQDCGLAPLTGARTLTRRLPAAHGGSAVPVPWTVDAGPADLALRNAQGAIALRRARLARLLLEAEAHGARPTVAQLAEALGVSQRTIQRDIAVLRDAKTDIPPNLFLSPSNPQYAISARVARHPSVILDQEADSHLTQRTDAR